MAGDLFDRENQSFWSAFIIEDPEPALQMNADRDRDPDPDPN